MKVIYVSIISAPRCSGQRLRPGHRAAAGGRSSHGPERFRRMAGAPRRGLLGSGTGMETGSRMQIRALEKHSCHFAAAAVVSDACGRAVGVSRSQSERQDLPGRDPNRCV